MRTITCTENSNNAFYSVMSLFPPLDQNISDYLNNASVQYDAKIGLGKNPPISELFTLHIHVHASFLMHVLIRY